MRISVGQVKQLLELFNNIDPYDGEWSEGKAQGIAEALDILDIKIEGINR